MNTKEFFELEIQLEEQSDRSMTNLEFHIGHEKNSLTNLVR